MPTYDFYQLVAGVVMLGTFALTYRPVLRAYRADPPPALLRSPMRADLLLLVYFTFMLVGAVFTLFGLL
ncbi:MAG: hypothetical protein GC191_11200 [Azospirillum sp.]|nr:hypothetical protein [Azospirillum sp.]